MKPDLTDNIDFLNLLEKIRSGSANVDEIRLYNNLFMSFQDDVFWREEEMGDKHIIEEMMRRNILSATKRPVWKLRLPLVVKYAAAAVLLVSVISILVKVIPDRYASKEKSNLSTVVRTKKAVKNATLELGDGRVIDLDTFNEGDVLKESGIQIKKTGDGQIVYHVLPAKTANENEQKNTISTSRGKQYQINLPDGTIVWLNAESSLSYPISFAADQRVVELKGEAFFKVAKNKKQPFIVNSNGQEVKVYGTQFNVSAYANDEKIITTLLEGSVGVRNKMGKSSVMLIPGDQSSFSLNDKEIPVSHLEPGDLENAIAWKNGYFRFVDQDILTISKKLSRWYDVDFIFKGKPTNEEFNGSISRSKNLAQVLEMLQNTGEIQFEVQGRRVIVM